jgi:serine/threonine protein kinase
LGVEPSRSAVLQDEYVLLERIGEHAGDVFRARHVRDRRTVVVRIWRCTDGVTRDRWLERARLASRVRHPVLPAIESYGRHGEEYAYVVSEFAEGERLDHFSDRVGIPPVASVVELFRHVCVGLNAAHRNGLAHEALHPRNLLVAEQANDPLLRLAPRVLDLVVPVFMRSAPPRVQDALFMAPEQLATWMQPGASAPRPADVRANIYSCGCLLHYVCTGGAPIQGRTLEELARAQSAGKLLPASRINPQVPPALDEVILRALTPVPSERYSSMAELAIALERVQTGSSASGVRPRVVPSVQGAFRERIPTERSAFDERPTSEAPRVHLRTPMRPPPIPSKASAQSAQPANASTEIDARSAPIGLFSSPPPAPVIAAVPRAAPDELQIEVQHATGAGASLRAFERQVRLSLFARKRIPGQRTLAIAAATLALVLWMWGVRSARNAATMPDAAPPHAGASGVASIAEPTARPALAVLRPALAVPISAPRVVPPPPLPTPVQADATRVRWRGHKPLGRSLEATVADESARPDVNVDPLREVDEPQTIIAPSAPPALSEPSTLAPHAPSGRSESAVHGEVARRDATAAPAAHVGAPSSGVPALPLRARAQSSDLVVHGSLATSVVRRAVERLGASFAVCYARAAAATGHNAFGSLEVEIEIDEHGRARDAQVNGAQLPNLGACVAQAAARLAADRPPDTGRVKASWKVAFAP